MRKLIIAGVALTLFSCTRPDPPMATQGMQGMGQGMGTPRMPGGCHAPASENQGKFGCYFDAAIELVGLPSSVFYHIDEYPDRGAAERARTVGSAVVEAYGRTFLQTVSGDGTWRPSGARRIATIGPLPRPPGNRITARFMQAMTRPGATTQPHSHDGPEAFHILSGTICMESPSGAATTGAGGNYWIGGGIPMQLSSVGTEIRRSLFIVLHPSSRPWMNVGIPWKPTGACQTSG